MTEQAFVLTACALGAGIHTKLWLDHSRWSDAAFFVFFLLIGVASCIKLFQ